MIWCYRRTNVFHQHAMLVESKKANSKTELRNDSTSQCKNMQDVWLQTYQWKLISRARGPHVLQFRSAETSHERKPGQLDRPLLLQLFQNTTANLFN